ncbi:hypothetical protein QUF76_13975 [Desulfobacterales bacterium HSG16]|nr:hypothetical protein [Desulfobacterales bacterium HSG16]
MEKKIDPNQQADLGECMIATLLHIDAMKELLIEKGLITKQEYETSVRKTRTKYERSTDVRLPVFDYKKQMIRINQALKTTRTKDPKTVDFNRTPIIKTNNFGKTVIPPTPDPPLQHEHVTNETVSSSAMISGDDQIIAVRNATVKSLMDKALPDGIQIEDGHLVLDDPESAKKICASCIAQDMILLPSLGVRDECLLPQLIKKRLEPGENALEGINSDCWMYVIAEKMLNEVSLGSVYPEDIPEQMSKAALQIDLALDEDISQEGIVSIIECAVLEIQQEIDEIRRLEREEEAEEENDDYADIDWQH